MTLSVMQGWCYDGFYSVGVVEKRKTHTFNLKDENYAQFILVMPRASGKAGAQPVQNKYGAESE